MIDNKSEISERFRLIFGERGAPDAISEKVGVPARTLLNYLNGKSEPKASVAAALAKEAGVNVEWLITGEGPMQPGEKTDQAEIPQIGGGPSSYPEIGAEQVLEVLAALERFMQNEGTEMETEKKVDLIRLICEELAAEDQDVVATARREGKLLEVPKVKRILRIAC
ncbi:MAG: helix-turn-helix domain-containing protein [Magnetococcales bacterium]|nr:helix-turn-helix domain-containing protein [Magnetococcales bacterium]